jgi:hypothetical protein
MDHSIPENAAAFMEKLAETTLRLLKEVPHDRPVAVEEGWETTHGEEYMMAIQLKNAICDLFGCIADGHSAPSKTELVTEEGSVETVIMDAISFRMGVGLNFPELTVPLACKLRKAALLSSVQTTYWWLVPGPGESVQLHGKPVPLRQQPPRKRATAVRVPPTTS